MACAPAPVVNTSAANSPALPPPMMMWAGIYTVMFCIAGGMIAYMYNPK